MSLTLESGGNKEQAVISFITMQLQLSSIFYMFSIGTRAHAFIRTILHGGAKVPKKIKLSSSFLLFVLLEEFFFLKRLHLSSLFVFLHESKNIVFVAFNGQIFTNSSGYGSGVQYRSAGRGFVVEHIPFTENYRQYSRSHFVRA